MRDEALHRIVAAFDAYMLPNGGGGDPEECWDEVKEAIEHCRRALFPEDAKNCPDVPVRTDDLSVLLNIAANARSRGLIGDTDRPAIEAQERAERTLLTARQPDDPAPTEAPR